MEAAVTPDPHPTPASPPRRLMVLLNPGSRNGGRPEIAEALRQAFADVQATFRVPASEAELVLLARQAVEERYDGLVVAGGDGTLNAVLGALAHTGLPLGVVPVGTANDTANHLNVPADLAAACALIKRGACARLDLFEANGRLFVGTGGMGVVADTALEVNRLKAGGGWRRRLIRALGGLAYVLHGNATLLVGRTIDHDQEVWIDGAFRGRFRVVALFVNNQPIMAKVVQPSPGARADDGVMNLCLLTRRSRLGGLLTVLLMCGGLHRRRRDAVRFEASEAEIRLTRPRTFIGDGEALTTAETVRLKVWPGALTVFTAPTP